MLNDSLLPRFVEGQPTATDLLFSWPNGNNKSVACQEETFGGLHGLYAFQALESEG
jgi:hypothetical protein